MSNGYTVAVETRAAALLRRYNLKLVLFISPLGQVHTVLTGTGQIAAVGMDRNKVLQEAEEFGEARRLVKRERAPFDNLDRASKFIDAMRYALLNEPMKVTLATSTFVPKLSGKSLSIDSDSDIKVWSML